MVYSKKFKENALKKILPPENRRIIEVADELGIAEQTLRNWKQKLDNNRNLSFNESVSPVKLNIAERYSLLIESFKIKKKNKGKWLRENGLHSNHLALWEKEFEYKLTNKEKKLKTELKELKASKKKLEKELLKKDKALAEMAALITLKKKAEAIWGDEKE